MNINPVVFLRELSKCRHCEVGPSRDICQHCPVFRNVGIYKRDMVEVLRNGLPAYKGGGTVGRTTLTDIQVKRALKMLKSGKSEADVAQAFGVSKGTITRLQSRAARKERVRKKIKSDKKKKRLESNKQKNIINEGMNTPLYCEECTAEPGTDACASCASNKGEDGENDGVYKSDLIENLLASIPMYKGPGGVVGRTTLTEAQITKVMEEIDRGESISHIARSMNVSRGVIYRLLRTEAVDYREKVAKEKEAKKNQSLLL